MFLQGVMVFNFLSTGKEMLIFEGNPNNMCLAVNERLKIHNKDINQKYKGCPNISMKQRYRKYINGLVNINGSQLLSDIGNSTKARDYGEVIFDMYYSTTMKVYDESMPQIRFYFEHYPVLPRSWIDIVVNTEPPSQHTNLEKHLTLDEIFPSEIISMKYKNTVITFFKPNGDREEAILLHLGEKFPEINDVRFYKKQEPKNSLLIQIQQW